MLPFLRLRTSTASTPWEGESTIIVDDGTIPVDRDNEFPKASANIEDDGNEVPKATQSPTSLPKTAFVRYSAAAAQSSNNTEMRSFKWLWSDGCVFFAPNTTGNFYGVLGAPAMAFAASQSGETSRGNYNTFTQLSDQLKDTFFSIMYDTTKRVLSSEETMPDARQRIGVRRAADSDSATSYMEAYMTLASACAGLAPAVHGAGVVGQRSVFVMDAHTPLDELMRPHSIDGVRLPPRPAVQGLDDAIGLAFHKVAQRGLLMLDSKPKNFVVDLLGVAPKVMAIDYDERFCSYHPVADARCIFVVNATIFLLSIPPQCTKDGSALHFEHIFSYRPILNLQQRLRLALEARGNEALCVALQEQLFHNRRFPTLKPLNTVELGRLSRSIIWMANHYAMFDGGNSFNVKCPIAGLKFDAPIWPQLLNHVLQLRHTPLGEEESANDLRRAELALVDGPLARLEDPPSGEATPSL